MVRQLRAVASTSSRLAVISFASSERPTPPGCHAYTSRPRTATRSGAAAAASSSCAALRLGFVRQKGDLIAGGVVGFRPERVGANHVGQLVARPRHDRDVESERSAKGHCQLALERSRLGAARQDHVPALEQGANVLEPLAFERCTKVSHADAALASQIDPAQEHDVSRHRVEACQTATVGEMMAAGVMGVA